MPIDSWEPKKKYKKRGYILGGGEIYGGEVRTNESMALPTPNDARTADFYLARPGLTGAQKDSAYNTTRSIEAGLSPQKFLEINQQRNEMLNMLRGQLGEYEQQQPMMMAEAINEEPILASIKEIGENLAGGVENIRQGLRDTKIVPTVTGNLPVPNYYKLAEGGADIAAGGLHTAFLPFTVPFGAATEGLKQTGYVGKEIAGGLERTMNLPFEAVKEGSNLVNRGLKEIGVDTKKLSKSTGISPELDEKINNLLTEVAGIYLLKKLHSKPKEYVEKKAPLPVFRERETGVQNAEGIGRETQAGSVNEGINGEGGGRLRARNNEEQRVEAINPKETQVQSSEIPNPIETIRQRAEQRPELITPKEKTILPEAEKQTSDLPSLEELKSNESAIQRMLSENKSPEEISKALKTPIEEVNKIKEPYFTKEEAPPNVKENFKQTSRDFKEVPGAKENVPKNLYKTLEDGTKVYLVDGTYVRNNVDIDFTMGGHEYVYPKYIPKGEVWLDKDINKVELDNTLRHELTEREKMISGEKYDTAHEIANKEEIAIRQGVEQPTTTEKQPYEMTKEEFTDKYAFSGTRNDNPNAHKQVISQALKEGKQVPEEVLKDYPDLAEKNKVSDIPVVKKEKGAGVPSEENKPQTPEGKEEYTLSKNEYIRSKYPDNFYTTIPHYIMKSVTDRLLQSPSLTPDNPEYNEVINRTLQLGNPNIRPDDFAFLEKLANNFVNNLTGKKVEKIPFQKYKNEDTYKFLDKYINVESAVNDAIDEYKNDYGKDLQEHKNIVENAIQRGRIKSHPDYPDLSSQPTRTPEKGVQNIPTEKVTDATTNAVDDLNLWKKKHQKYFTMQGELRSGTPEKLKQQYSDLLEKTKIEFNKVKENFVTKARKESEQSKLETEELNKEFAEQSAKDREGLDLPKEELIADKLADGEKLTPEEQKYYEENQFAPEGYKYDTEGNLYKAKETSETPRAIDKKLWDVRYKDLEGRIPKKFHKAVVEKAAKLGNIGEGIKDYPEIEKLYKEPTKAEQFLEETEPERSKMLEGQKQVLNKTIESLKEEPIVKETPESLTKGEVKLSEPVKPRKFKVVEKPKELTPPKGSNAAIVNFKDGKQSKLPTKDLDVIGTDLTRVDNITYGKADLNKSGGIKWETFKESQRNNSTSPAFAGIKESIPTSLDPKQKPVKASEIISQVEKDLGVPIRIGKVTNPRASAFYKQKPEVIRMREANNLNDMSHEIAHHIDKKVLGGFTNVENKKRFEQWADELRNLDYDKKKKRTYEGFAEFVRHYLTRDDASQVAPKFNKYFENEFLPQNPDILKTIKTAKESITAWRDQGALSRVISQIDFTGKKPETPFMERFENLKVKAQQLTTDRLAPLRYAVDQIVKEAGGEKLRPSENPYQIAMSVQKTAAAKAREFIMNGTFDFQLNKTGKSLKEVIEPISKDAENAIAYAYAKHAKSLHERGINPGITLEDANYILKNYSKPEYEKFSQEFTEWSNYLLDYLVDAGGLSKEAATRMREVNPFYIPLKRSFVDGGISAPKGSGMVDLPSPIKRIKGSGREIINPLESMIAQTEQIISIADKARVARALANLSERFEGTGKWIEKVPAPMEAKITELDNLRKQIENAGGDLSNADMDAMITLFSQGKGYFGKDNIVSIFKNGKREYFQLHPMLYDAMKGLDKVTLPWALDYILGKPTRMIRLGATGIRAGFSLITNPIRDAQTFMLQSEKAGVRPDKVAKALLEELMGKSEFVKEFKRAGGEMSQPLGLDRKVLQNTIQEVLANDAKSKSLNIVKHPIEALRKLLSFPEAGTRLAEFEAVMNKYKPRIEEAKNKGDLVELKKLQEDAAIEASNSASEVTVNFKRAGTYSAVLNQIVPFFNPAVQGLSRMGRTVYEHPLRSGIRATTLMTAPTLALWWLNKDEDWYKNLPDWQKYGFWNFKVGDEIVRLPKPFEWGYIFGAVPEGVANSLYQKNPKYYREAIGETLEAMTPDVIPGAIKPVAETYFNWDIFRERPIVSQTQEGLLPEQQFSTHTSEFAKEAGKILNISPSKLDHLLSGYTGGLATDILNALPKEYKESADIPVVGRLFTRQSAVGFGGKNVQEFYDALEKAESIYRTENLAEKQGRDFSATKEQESYLEYRKDLRNAAKDLKKLREELKEISGMEIDPEIKERLTKEIEFAAAKKAEEAISPFNR